ncbi:DUF2620 domain-containing protein [Lactobacillus mulieris]|uniref:DUF2620 domain-containing protein n=1 Tax=Lactobacillus TaxID=1578 RepID=UPI00117BAFA2|nr:MULTISPECIES: DUF2620 domain-containing protein [Lactobacillus]KAA9243628.1 DUF2620 family protein [Lactobacillus jensenii]MCW8124283.1 DUF2620 domain-containing protein [Lactobacillus mulieris]MCZ9599357.1 DUF2620 domain-containing protein [Lactobacillus mulieris]MDK7327498.1 DUF2620 domain-containing protein [Lactobacillus mulieris]TRT38362.1 DUF2620 domain-containing protein [Lactobacillus sp. c10Ua232AE]
MIKVVIGGQMGKDEIHKDLLNLLSKKDIEVKILSDLDAAMAIQNNEADFYIGACETGAGGALAMATALLGSDKTLTVASPTNVLSQKEIEQGVKEGKVAFGFTFNSKDRVLPMIVKALSL